MFDILIWSKQLILEQIGYLSQQVEIFKNLKSIDPSACFMVEYWVEWLQHELAACSTNFDFYNLMIQAQKRIDQIPNFYLKKQVYYNREQRIVESLYKSEREQRIRRYLLHLPTDFTKEKTYPAFVFVHDVRNNEEESARKIGNLLAKYDLPIIGVFPKGYPDLGTTYFGLEEIMNCIADVCSKYSIDKNRIYLTGEGSAGFEVLQLAQNYPDKFAALTVAFCKLNDNFRLQNLALTPMWFFYEQNQQDEYLSFAEKINRFQGSIRLTNLTSDTSREDYLFSLPYFRWLLQQRKAVPTKIYLHIKHLKPSAAFWVKPLAQNDYNEAALLEATLDSNNIFLATKNLPALAVTLSKLPPTAVYPLTVFFDNHQQLKIEDKKIDEIIFKREGQKWNILKQAPQYLEKIPAVCGPLAAIFDKPIKFIYSTLDIDNKYNQLCYQLTKQSSQRGRDEFLNQLLIADTVQAKQKIEANVITFGNEASNAYLKKIVAKLPLRIQQNGIRFGRSFCDAPGCAAIYIFPNPENPNYLILVGTAPDTSGLKNIARLWEPFFSNVIFDYDYILFGDGVVRNSYTNWIDYGTFDHYWSLPWFQPLFTKGPKFWHNDISAGLDANQLSLNRNWKGGGKGNFTWKIYAKMEFLYAKEKFNWKNSLYCAFGQISVQENENWLAPEKSTDIIDFDSVLKLTLKKFIDPYLAFSMDTQFHDGYNPRSKILTSRFINPLILSQSSGFARNVTTKKILETTTRVGYAAKEVIVSARQFRALWTGDEARGYKMDGGFEWLTESKSEFAKGIILTNKLKLFQAIFSSISPDKDPHKNWQKTDLYWEQMFTAQLTQYILFNVIAKFIYDRDTSVGGQFLENASFGLSYKF